MSQAIAKLDLDTISQFQRELHDESPSGEGDGVTSNFLREFRKTTWYTHLPAKLKCNVDGNDLVYTANNTFHYLMYTYMRQFFPALRVKEKYRDRIQICWPHNAGTNGVDSAQLKFDDETPQSIDSVW